MNLGDLKGKRIELLEDKTWVAAIAPQKGPYINAGSKGTVDIVEIFPGCRMAHIIFDRRVANRSGNYYAIGIVDDPFDENIQGWLKVIGEAA